MDTNIKIYVFKRMVYDELFNAEVVGINFILMPMMTKYKG